MTQTVLETDMTAATNALRQWREGIHIEDDLYRHFLREHGKGEHKGMTLNLCPACADEHKE